MSRSRALTRPRRLFTSSHPAAAIPSPSSAQGRSGMCRRCSWLLSRHKYRSGFLGAGEYRSLDPYTNTPGRSSSGPRESRKGWTACGWAMESPVLTTRSGASASSDLIHDISRWRPGVRCASEMCSTRSGAAPAGSTGTSWRRRANQFRSAPEPYAKAVPPRTAAVPRARRARDRIPLWCHVRGVPGPQLNAPDDGARERFVIWSGAGARRAGRAGQDGAMAALKDQLRSDLTTAMKARDKVRTRTLRMALTAVSTAEVARSPPRGSRGDEVVTGRTKEAKGWGETADGFSAAGRTEQASAERAEGEILDG